jgi:hypothetical protein
MLKNEIIVHILQLQANAVFVLCLNPNLAPPPRPKPHLDIAAIKMQNVLQRLLKDRKYSEGCCPCTGFIEWYMKMKCCFYNAIYLFVCRDQLKNTCFNNLLLDWFCKLKSFFNEQTRGGKQTFFSRPQITNPQILGPIALSQLFKILRYASPQIANLQIFSYWSANRKFANFFKILHNSDSKQP